ENFKPYFYIKVPQHWKKQNADIFIDGIKDLVPPQHKHGIAEYNLVKKHDYYGFTNHELFNFMEIKFKNTYAFREYEKLFMRPLNVNGLGRFYYKRYEAGI